MRTGPRRLAARLGLFALTSLALPGCAPATAPVELTVLAASSLARPFEAIAADYMAASAGTTVRISPGGSGTLVDQLAGGAPADVLATADEATMARAAASGLIRGEPVVFATNTMVLITPAGNPARVTGLDSSLAGARLVVCADSVPCGATARALAADAKVTLRPVSEELAVGDVLGKVVSGEADAGLVYVTDALAAGAAVTAIELPGSARRTNRYPIAVTATTRQAAAAARFVDHVRSPAGREVLRRAGFGPP